MINAALFVLGLVATPAAPSKPACVVGVTPAGVSVETCDGRLTRRWTDTQRIDYPASDVNLADGTIVVSEAGRTWVLER